MPDGVLNQGDLIPQADVSSYWPWDSKAFHSYYDRNRITRVGMVGNNNRNPDIPILTRWDPSRETPTLSAYLDRTKGKLDQIITSINPRYNKTNNTTYIPRDVFSQVEKELSNRNIDTVLGVLGERVQHVMSLSAESEAARIKSSWESKVLPDLLKSKSEFTKRRVELEMKMADALGQSFMSSISSSQATDSVNYANNYMSSQFKLYSDSLSKHLQGMVSEYQSAFEKLLPEAPKSPLEGIDPNQTLEFIGKNGDLVSARVNMDTGEYAYGKTKGRFDMADPNSINNSADVDLGRFRATYMSAKTAWDNRKYELDQDYTVQKNAYENLRSYLRGTVGSSLIGYLS